MNNSRFYVVALSLCLSVFILCILQIIIIDERVRNIRLQQVYALVAVLYWYVVLFISAFAKVVGKKSWLPAVLFTRRAFGFMVAFFALLHAAISFYAQLGGFKGVSLLPIEFRLSLILGLLALIVLLFMASLSIDKIVQFSRFKHWKVLSRISYIAGIITILHVWIIGTHLSSALVQFAAFQALVILFGLEAWRLILAFHTKGKRTSVAILLGVTIWLLLSVGLVAMKLYVISYSKSHASHDVESGAVIHAH